MIAIVVVTYNRRDMLSDLIATLREQTYADNRIVVVNNGSTDGTTEWLAQQTDLTVINQDNVGGAGGFFTGMKYAAENGFDYCWVMDDDVLCPPDALQSLVDAFAVRPGAGFICSRIVDPQGETANTPGPDMRPGPDGSYADTFDLVVSEAMVKVSACTFVSVLIPTGKIREVGLPYRQFFIWGDDTEYTYRLSSTAPCYMACRSVVTHRRVVKGGLDIRRETNPARIRNYFYLTRNSYVYRRRYEGKKEVLWAQIHDIKSILGFLLRLDFLRLGPVWRGFWASLWFNPKPEFPAAKEQNGK